MKTTKKKGHRLAWTGILLILALLLLASCVPAPVTNGTETGTGTSGEKPEIINFDKASAAKAEIYPEYTMDVKLTGSDGKTLRSDSVLKADGGKLKSRISFDYKSTMPRDIALLYFINGIPQKLSVDGKEAEYYNVFSLPSGKTFDLSCAPDGVLPDKNAVVSIVLLCNRNVKPRFYGDKTDFEENLIYHRADILELEKSIEQVSITGNYLSIKEVSEARGIPSDEEIERAKKSGSKLTKEDYITGTAKYLMQISEIDFPITVVNTLETSGLLSQESAVTVNYNEPDKNQVYFEAVGIPGIKNRTTVFLGNSPIPAFDGKNTVEWQCEKGQFFNVDFSTLPKKEYFESNIFAVTLFDGGKNCALTPNLLLVNTTERVDMNKVNIRMMTELYDEDGKKADNAIKKYNGQDLSYLLQIKYKYPIFGNGYVFALIDGAPVECIYDGMSGFIHQIILSNNETQSARIVIPKEEVRSEDFVLTIGFSESFSGSWYSPMLLDSNSDVLSKKVIYSSNGTYLTDEKHYSDIGTRRTSMTLTTDEKSATKLIRIPYFSDACFYYHGRCLGEDSISRSFAFFNGELIRFCDGSYVCEWSGKRGDFYAMQICIPKEKLKHGGEIIVFTTRYVEGEHIEQYAAFALIDVYGESGDEASQIFIDEDEFLLNPYLSNGSLNDRFITFNYDAVLLRIAETYNCCTYEKHSYMNKEYLYNGTFVKGNWQISRFINDALRINTYCYYDPKRIR